MKRLSGTGGLSAAAGFLLLALGGSAASAQPVSMSLPVQVTIQLAPADQASAVDQALGGQALGGASGALAELVRANLGGAELDSELSCLATAVYFEAKGEPLEGQLAVAEVVENRARSGRYPSSLCGVVRQKAQFSFVRAGGRFPAIDPGCPYWHRAKAIARIAAAKLASTELSRDVLWYHADYVAPTWGQRLSRVKKVGAHIFYRA